MYVLSRTCETADLLQHAAVRFKESALLLDASELWPRNTSVGDFDDSD